MSNSQQHKSWSLQDDKRSKDLSDKFKPTGKRPKSYTSLYVVLSIVGMVIVSAVLTMSSEKKLEACFFFGSCFNSKDDVVLYTLYVFTTIFVVVFAVISAYLFGKKIGDRYKQ